MPNRNQTQDSQNQGRKNPGNFSPDDDEAQTADQTRAGQPMQQDQRARDDEDPAADIEDEEAEDDEDDADGLGARP